MNKRQVAQRVELFDVEVDGPPPTGAQVWALGAGGRLVEIVWRSDSAEFFYAWCHYPDVKPETKARMLKQYKLPVDG